MQSPVVEKRSAVPRILASGVVFGWNAVFVALACALGIPLLYTSIREPGIAPIASDFLATLAIAVVIAASSVLLLRKDMRKAPARLLSFFYGVQAPLIMVVFARLFFIRELTAGSMLVFGAIIVAAVSIGVAVFRPYEQRAVAAHAQYALASIALVTAASVSAYIALYVPAVFGKLIHELMPPYSIGFHSGGQLFWFFLGGGIFIAFSSLILGAPFGMIYTFTRHFARQRRYHSQRFGRVPVGGVAAAALIALWTLAGNQTHNETIQAVQAHVAAPTKDSARALANDRVKGDLVDAYLAPYRYLGVREGDGHMRWVYGEGPAALWMQWAHNLLARPFLFDGPRVSALENEASTLYEALFDAPIQRAERAAIDHAYASTYERFFRKAEASVLDIDAKRVRVTQRTFTESAGTTTWHERYDNLTQTPQEVLYYFSLPENAAITGLWLGEGDEMSAAYTHQVAPRGAAQRTYRAEVRRRIDPALVEQVGPRQFRLRAYPVVTTMHMWLSYAAAPGVRPEILEQRNAFGDAFPASASSAIATARPFSGKVAIVVDRSYSMAKHAAAVARELDYARANMPQAEVILAASPSSGRELAWHKLSDALDTEALGSSTLDTLLQGLGEYDAAFVITDDDAYDRAKDFTLPALPKQLYLVHLGGFARAYPDAVQEHVTAIGHSIAEASQQREEPPVPALTKTPEAQIAAKLFIAAHASDMKMRPYLHDIAKATSVVTPLSSMIVLVNDTQKQRLEEESRGKNAFDREAEDGKEASATKSAPFEVSATPEPEEWMLIAVLLALVLFSRQRAWA